MMISALEGCQCTAPEHVLEDKHPWTSSNIEDGHASWCPIWVPCGQASTQSTLRVLPVSNLKGQGQWVKRHPAKCRHRFRGGNFGSSSGHEVDVVAARISQNQLAAHRLANTVFIPGPPAMSIDLFSPYEGFHVATLANHEARSPKLPGPCGVCTSTAAGIPCRKLLRRRWGGRPSRITASWRPLPQEANSGGVMRFQSRGQ